jgi:hypothetical protein
MWAAPEQGRVGANGRSTRLDGAGAQGRFWLREAALN